ncbi:MAG: hypothetical protein Q8P88_02405 [Candidatus Jorgensenbacteria bacterium]|nr:hypothetical protein [Candidatus Jorgensenbacteria bacterium]
MRIPEKVEKAMKREWFDTLTATADVVGREVDLSLRLHVLRELRVGHFSSLLEREYVRRSIIPPVGTIETPHFRVGNQKNPYLYGVLRKTGKRSGEYLPHAAGSVYKPREQRENGDLGTL